MSLLYFLNSILQIVIGACCILILTPVTVILTLFCLTYKSIVWILVKIQYGDKIQFMTCFDANVFMDIPEAKMYTVLAFSGPEMNVKWLKEEWMMKFFPTNEQIDPDVAKLLRLPISKYGYYMWMNVGDVFDMNYHVRVIDHSDISEDKLCEHIGNAVNQPFPEDKPQWEVLCFPNVIKRKNGHKIQNNTLLKRCVFVIRGSHAYADGIHIMKNFLFRFSTEPYAANIPSAPKFSFLQRIYMFFAVLATLPSLTKLLFFVKRTTLYGPKLTGEKILAASTYFDFEKIRRIKKKFGVSVTSILLSTISESLLDYSKKCHSENPQDLVIAFPFPMSVPGIDDMTLENSVIGSLAYVPTSRMTPEQRLIETHSELRRRLTSPLLFAILSAIVIFNNVPSYFLRFVASASPATSLLSSIPGPPTLPYLLGKEITDLMFWIPHKGKSGISASVMSMNGQMRLGLQVDKGIIPYKKDVDFIIKKWSKTIDNLSKQD